MTTFFAPFVNDKPAVVDIKGHRLLILSRSQDDVFAALERTGGDHVGSIELLDLENQDELLSLAAEIQGGVVVSPDGVSVRTMLSTLEAQLPWVQ